MYDDLRRYIEDRDVIEREISEIEDDIRTGQVADTDELYEYVNGLQNEADYLSRAITELENMDV